MIWSTPAARSSGARAAAPGPCRDRLRQAEGRGQVDTFVTEVSQDTWIFFPWDMALQYVEPYRGT